LPWLAVPSHQGSAVTMSSDVKPPAVSTLDVTTYSYGGTIPDPSSPKAPAEVSAHIMTDQECKAAAPSAYLADLQFCASVRRADGVGTCAGDSGSPLVVAVIGVLSHVQRTGQEVSCSAAPGIYAATAPDQPWIDQIVAGGDVTKSGQSPIGNKGLTTARAIALSTALAFVAITILVWRRRTRTKQ
jgi:hypothetical protein